jgi:hypothetical protein
MRMLSGPSSLPFALAAKARLLFPWGELIIGFIADTTVLALGIFIIVTVCIGLL